MSSALRTAAVVPPRATHPAAVSGQARLTIEHAFERFAATVTPLDRSQFQNTQLEDVKNAALQIEKDLAARRSLRNMRKLFPFLQGLEHYSKSIEVLCNGTPYLPWIWASHRPQTAEHEDSNCAKGARQAHASGQQPANELTCMVSDHLLLDLLRLFECIRETHRSIWQDRRCFAAI